MIGVEHARDVERTLERMRRRKRIPSARLEDRGDATEMRGEIIRVQMLDHLVADHGVERLRDLEAVKVNAIGICPTQGPALVRPSRPALARNLRGGAVVAAIGERPNEATLARPDLVNPLW